MLLFLLLLPCHLCHALTLALPPPCWVCTPAAVHTRRRACGHAQAPDLSVLSSPSSLKEVWLFRLHREAPNTAFLLLK